MKNCLKTPQWSRIALA